MIFLARRVAEPGSRPLGPGPDSDVIASRSCLTAQRIMRKHNECSQRTKNRIEIHGSGGRGRDARQTRYESTVYASSDPLYGFFIRRNGGLACDCASGKRDARRIDRGQRHAGWRGRVRKLPRRPWRRQCRGRLPAAGGVASVLSLCPTESFCRGQASKSDHGDDGKTAFRRRA